MRNERKLGVILSFAAQAVSIIVGLAYSPVMIRILGQNEYGLYQLVQSVVNYLNLMNFGFSGAYIRYYAQACAKEDEREIANVNGMFMKIFLFISVLALLAGAVLLMNIHLLGNQLTESDYATARQLLIIMVINMAISFPGNLFSAFVLANERFIYHKTLAIVFNLFVPLFNLPVLLLGYGSVGIVSVTLFLSVLRTGFNLWYCFRKLHMKINMAYSDRAILLDLFSFTFFIFLSDIVDQMNTNVDKFLLGRMIGTASVAVYSVGFNLRNYYLIASWVIPELYIPEVHKLAAEEENHDKLNELFIRIGRYNNYICLLILTGFILFGKTFIALWVGADYENSYYVCVILLLAGYIPSVQTLGVNIQDAKNRHKMRSVVYFIIACFNVIFSIFLIRKWGEIGTALGTLIAVVLGTGFFMNYYYQKRIGLNIGRFWKEILKWTVPVCGLCGLCWLLKKQIVFSGWGTLLAGIAIYSGLYLIMLWYCGFSAEERKKIQASVHQKVGGLRKNER